MNHIRDVTSGEDASQVRTGNDPGIMASLRNLAIAVLKLTATRNIAAACRHYARDATLSTGHPRAHPAITETAITSLCGGPGTRGGQLDIPAAISPSSLILDVPTQEAGYGPARDNVREE